MCVNWVSISEYFNQLGIEIKKDKTLFPKRTIKVVGLVKVIKSLPHWWARKIKRNGRREKKSPKNILFIATIQLIGSFIIQDRILQLLIQRSAHHLVVFSTAYSVTSMLTLNAAYCRTFFTELYRISFHHPALWHISSRKITIHFVLQLYDSECHFQINTNCINCIWSHIISEFVTPLCCQNTWSIISSEDSSRWTKTKGQNEMPSMFFWERQYNHY